MSHEEHIELTQEERAAFAGLPREREPGRLLEERTVQALRQRHLLGQSRRPLVRRTAWVAAVAASVALFVSGIAVGQWLGSRAVADSMASAQQQTALEVASAVQRAGSAYVTALTALVQFADSADDPALAQGREVALTALYAAARELSQLAPDDPITVAIRQRLEAAALAGSGTGEQIMQNVVWF